MPSSVGVDRPRKGQVGPGGMTLSGKLPDGEGTVSNTFGGDHVKAMVSIKGIARNFVRTAKN